jgi:hypothetical protein
MNRAPEARDSNDPVYSDAYYDHLARTMGEAAAEWARLPRAERERELTKLHLLFNTPDDLSTWPPELGGDPPLPTPP